MAVCAILVMPVFAASDIQLKKPNAKLGTDLATALAARQSVREFADKKVNIDDLAAILWAANGVNRADGKHTTPVAMGRDVLRIYVTSADGTYLYVPASNTLKLITQRDLRAEVVSSMQGKFKKAPVILIITADTSAYPFIIGKQERISYSYASAGGAAQNVYLACTALKMGTCFVAGVDSDGVKKNIAPAKNELPMLIMPLGYLK